MSASDERRVQNVMTTLVRGFGLLLAVASAAILPQTARAQDSLPVIELQQFKPAPGATDYLNLYGSMCVPSFDYNYGLYFNGADGPLRLPTTGEFSHSTVASQWAIDVILSMGFFDFLELGVGLPVTLSMGSDSLEPFEIPLEQLGSAGLGDMRASLKGTFLDFTQYPVGLALVVIGFFPTGDKTSMMGDDGPGVEPRVVVEVPITNTFRVVVNLGYRFRSGVGDFRENLVGNELTYGLGVHIPLVTDPLALIVEIDGSVSLTEDDHGLSEVKFPIEGLAVFRYELNEWVTFSAGVVGGFTAGYGTPSFRLILGAGAQWVSEDNYKWDHDGDGLIGTADECPRISEDFDDFDDEDGCPDLDDDEDGVLDERDDCPNTDPGETVGKNGCVDADFDGDGLIGDKDECPEEAEDVDGYADLDGCPDPDNDNDGIPDILDQCPLSHERWNELEDEDGCPDDNPDFYAYIELDRIHLTQKIHFRSNSDEIQSKSHRVLDDVAKLMLAHPEVRRVKIEGHTDDRGDEDENLELSQRRADSVRNYLIEAGVEEDRLSAVGLGESAPLGDNETDEGRAKNRRVEFHIVEMAR